MKGGDEEGAHCPAPRGRGDERGGLGIDEPLPAARYRNSKDDGSRLRHGDRGKKASAVKEKCFESAPTCEQDGLPQVRQ
ncbi:unnamed protein product [Arctogadus glacialis]